MNSIEKTCRKARTCWAAIALAMAAVGVLLFALANASHNKQTVEAVVTHSSEWYPYGLGGLLLAIAGILMLFACAFCVSMAWAEHRNLQAFQRRARVAAQTPRSNLRIVRPVNEITPNFKAVLDLSQG